MCERPASSIVTGADAFSVYLRSDSEPVSTGPSERITERSMKLQLPNVAGPRMMHKSLHELLRDVRDRLAHVANHLHGIDVQKLAEHTVIDYKRTRFAASFHPNDCVGLRIE
jgi:hypothetical protein